ncbi:MAG: hypothetical protein FWH42_02445 [Dehalococcoidia bacterium]|nr:hypothetical protein [Dehalococcoidia bacterium]
MTEQGYIPVSAIDEAIERFRSAVSSGQNWYLALLEAVRHWPISRETYDGQNYNYVIADEALDMLQIAARLLATTEYLVPEEERVAYLFHNRPPISLTQEKMGELIGKERLSQHYNFFYGITAEEALLQAVEEEVRKESHGLNVLSEIQIINETYNRIYEAPQRLLLNRFRKEKGYATNSRSMTMEHLKEFSYWRFKYRLKHSDRARIASDTKKALDWLKRNSDKQVSVS